MNGNVELHEAELSAAANEGPHYSDLQIVTAGFYSVPRSQMYYWSATWQAGERESVRDLQDGRSLMFESGRDAAAWLLADDDPDDVSDEG